MDSFDARSRTACGVAAHSETGYACVATESLLAERVVGMRLDWSVRSRRAMMVDPAE